MAENHLRLVTDRPSRKTATVFNNAYAKSSWARVMTAEAHDGVFPMLHDDGITPDVAIVEELEDSLKGTSTIYKPDDFDYRVREATIMIETRVIMTTAMRRIYPTGVERPMVEASMRNHSFHEVKR